MLLRKKTSLSKSIDFHHLPYLSCLSAFIRHPHHLSFPKFRRESSPPVIPEIFNRESMFLNNLDPGLKIAGVTDLGMIETFRGDVPYVMPEIFYQASTFFQ